MLDWAFGVLVDTLGAPAEGMTKMLERLREVMSVPPWPDEAVWGETPTARARAAAMADLAGGPAPIRRRDPADRVVVPLED